MNFDVILIGTDINAYYMARCYHELYHKKVTMIGMQEMAFTSLSNIINLYINPNLNKSDVFVQVLNSLAKSMDKEKLVLIGCNDNYVRLIVENKDKLDPKFVFNYPSLEIVKSFLNKDIFYEKYKDILDFPKTLIYKCGKDKIKDEFNYPIVLKPADGIKYHDHSFEGMSKVFKIKNFEELKMTIKKIEDSKYDGNLIIQEFIPGDDSNLYDCIIYANQDKKVELMTFAQIGLQEQTQTGVGNCTVLVNGFQEHGLDENLITKLKNFMEDIGYKGFAEVDLKYDVRDHKYKVFEINPRQARSSYYLAFCNHNLVKHLVDDLIKNEKHDFYFMKDKVVLSFVPKKVVFKYISSIPLKQEIEKLLKEKKYVRPLHYKNDKKLSRKIYLFLRDINYKRKYKKLKW